MNKKQWVNRRSGFSLIEMMFTVAIFALTLAIAVPSYRAYIVQARSSKAISDIELISAAVERFRVTNMDNLPPDLAAMDRAWQDPWGNPYEYTDLTGIKGNAGARKNKNLVPINTDFDLYSKGPDGASVAALTAKTSQDDIVRANNGSFVGVAADY